MKAARTVLLVMLFAIPLLFAHYHLPFSEVVRIVGTEVVRVDGAAVEGGAQTSQDVRFIHAVTPDGASRVYRNEDTGWGWPPYFKFSSADLAAEAEEAASGSTEQWHVITRYGWRIPILSGFPNATALEPVASPREAGWPWFALLVLGGVFTLLLWLLRRVSRVLAPG